MTTITNKLLSLVYLDALGSDNLKLIQEIDSLTRLMLYFSYWQRSSVAEQGTHKPLVAGSNPAVATFLFMYIS